MTSAIWRNLSAAFLTVAPVMALSGELMYYINLHCIIKPDKQHNYNEIIYAYILLQKYPV